MSLRGPVCAQHISTLPANACEVGAVLPAHSVFMRLRTFKTSQARDCEVPARSPFSLARLVPIPARFASLRNVSRSLRPTKSRPPSAICSGSTISLYRNRLPKQPERGAAYSIEGARVTSQLQTKESPEADSTDPEARLLTDIDDRPGEVSPAPRRVKYSSNFSCKMNNSEQH